MIFRLILGFMLCMHVTVAAALQPQPRIVGGELATTSYPYMAALLQRTIGVTLSDDSTALGAVFLSNSPEQSFTGPLVDCGVAAVTCQGATNAICLIARDGSSFTGKARNCEAGGGIGAIIYNTYGDSYYAFPLISGYDGIPVVSVSRASGAELLQRAGESVGVSFQQADFRQSFCGGVYIGEGWVLTAAHCANGILPESIAVMLGSQSLAGDDASAINVQASYIHSSYDKNTVRWDFALLQLAATPAVEPAVIPDVATVEAAFASAGTVTAIGRGQRTEVALNDDTYTSGTEALYEVDMALVDNIECNRAYSSLPANFLLADSQPVKPEMLCAGDIDGGFGTCFGDSGGPLLLAQNEREYVVGITSWGLGCAQPNVYDVFSRVTSASDMIDAALSGQDVPGIPVTRSSIASTTTTSSGNEIVTGTGMVSWTLLSLLLGAGLFRRVKST